MLEYKSFFLSLKLYLIDCLFVEPLCVNENSQSETQLKEVVVIQPKSNFTFAFL